MAGGLFAVLSTIIIYALFAEQFTPEARHR